MQLLSLNKIGRKNDRIRKETDITGCEVRRVWRISCRRYECRYKASGTFAGQTGSGRNKAGDKLEVFIYKDSQDRLIATTNEPLLMVGQAGLLKVKQVTRIGAFLDWGLEKDLLLPYHEQTTRIFEGQECLVAVYVDKSSRLCATMKVYPYLSKETPYKEGDQVKGRVYQISENFGVFVAVDNKYSALIPAREAKGKYRLAIFLTCVSAE